MGVAQTKPDPRRYFEAVGEARGPIAEQEPVCLYIETTNRCNLLCETCPRTFEDLEPPADMSWALFTHIVDQFPNIARVVLHGVGEPMMVKALPRMIRYLKERGAYVLFNTNGTLLTERKGRELIAVGLDELRVSLDAAAPRAFLAVRGKNMFARIVRNVRAFTALQRAEGIDRPLVSLWLTGLKETVDQLPAFVRLAHRIGVGEIHLQRLVFTPQGQGLARAQSALFEQLAGEERMRLAEAARLAGTLGVSFNASGAAEPGTSLKRSTEDQPWSLCRRPWTLMYFTAAIIPVLDEEGAIGPVLAAMPREWVDEIVVVDGGSHDRTVAESTAAGARVLVESERGYGRACARGVAAAVEAGAEILIFLDGDGGDRPEMIPTLVQPILNSKFDFVIGSRTRGLHEKGSIGAHQLLGGRLIGGAIGLIYGVRYTDMCAFRAIRADALERLGMHEMTYGWNLEMQMRAASARLRILELPVPYGRRLAGRSKVAGTLCGTLKAGGRILATFARILTERRPPRNPSDDAKHL